MQDELSPPGDTRIEVVDAERYNSVVIGIDGHGLRVPSDLDESICAYQALSPANRAKFDRAAFWLDIASANWETSVSVTFAALVSAMEAFTEKSQGHSFTCPVCKKQGTHEVIGATKRFKEFLGAHAKGKLLDNIYGLRSHILHGAELMQIDKALDFGWDPPYLEQMEMIRELSGVAKVAMRHWLRNPPAAPTEDSDGILADRDAAVAATGPRRR